MTTGSGTIVDVVDVVDVDVDVDDVVIVWITARIHCLRPSRMRHTTMTGFVPIRVETRVPSAAFAQDCPTDTAFADTAGMAVHSKRALRTMKSFFTTIMLVTTTKVKK